MMLNEWTNIKNGQTRLQFPIQLDNFLEENPNEATRFFRVAKKYGLIKEAPSYNITSGSIVFLANYEMGGDYPNETLTVNSLNKYTYIPYQFEGDNFIDAESKEIIKFNRVPSLGDKEFQMLYILDEQALSTMSLNIFLEFLKEAEGIQLDIPLDYLSTANEFFYLPRTKFQQARPGDQAILVSRNNETGKFATGSVKHVGEITSTYYQKGPVVDKLFGITITIPGKVVAFFRPTSDIDLDQSGYLPWFVFVRHSEAIEH